MNDQASVFSHLGRVVILVHDQEQALRFYRDVLGFGVLHDQDAGGLRYLHLGLPGDDHAGVWLMPAMTDAERALVGRQAGNHPLLVLYTDDLDAVRRTLSDHDVEIWADRTDDTSRSLHFRDLAGNVVVAAQLTG